MDMEIEIKEEPIWLERTEHVEPESAMTMTLLKEETKPESTEPGPPQPSTDVEETTIEEHTEDQLVRHSKEENSAENRAVLTGVPVDTCDRSCDVLKTGSELMCAVPAGNVSNQSKGESIRHYEHGIPLSSTRHPRTHLLIDSGMQPKICTKCGEVFLIKDVFKMRRTKEWADCCDKCCKLLCMKNPHCCNECGKNFNYKSGLAQHLLFHSGERPHCCDKCGRTFSTRSNLNKHLLVHSGKRLHCCKQCGRTFVFKQVLTRHYLTHSGERGFCCKQCGKTFCLKGVLTQHYLTHTGERPHFCSKCGKSFRFKSNLTRHLLTHSVKCHTV